MRYYAVVFQRWAGDFRGFHDEFLRPAALRYWWHYLDSLYLIATEWSAQQLSDHFTHAAHAHGLPRAHLVLEVQLAERWGSLPQEAWAWMDTPRAQAPSWRPERHPEP